MRPASFPWTLLVALLSIACFVPASRAQEDDGRRIGSDDESVPAAEEPATLEPTETGTPEAEPGPDLEELSRYLDQVETSTRRYFYSWVAVGAGLTASQVYVAATWDSRVVRGSYWIGTALAGTSLLLQLISPKPALFGVARYRELPSSTPSERQAKLEYGERILAGQAKADRRATSVAQHTLGVAAALGAGLGVGLGWDNSLRQAVTRTLGVFLIAELQIISRPRTSIQLMDAWKRDSVQLGLVPMLERDAQGLMLAGTF